MTHDDTITVTPEVKFSVSQTADERSVVESILDHEMPQDGAEQAERYLNAMGYVSTALTALSAAMGANGDDKGATILLRMAIAYAEYEGTTV